MKNIFPLFAVLTVVFVIFSMLPDNLKDNEWIGIGMIIAIFVMMDTLKKNKNSKN